MERNSEEPLLPEQGPLPQFHSINPEVLVTKASDRPVHMTGNGHASSWEPIEADHPLETGKQEEKTRFFVPTLLFFLTLLTTLLAGSYLAGAYRDMNDFLRRPADITSGIPFSFTLMSILFIHEMGHYLTSKSYGVKTTLPYFIPGLWGSFGLIGTFGAFIRMKSPILRKNALLDIGAAGPIAGFVVSVIAVGFGIHSAKIIQEGGAMISLGEPLIFTFLKYIQGRVPPPGYDLAIGPVGFAGWIGLLVTSLNLLPMGQLDGGHIGYALFGRKQRFISMAVVLSLFFFGAIGWPGWFVWAVLGVILGLWHPPILDEEFPLDFKHRLVGWGSIVLFILTFMPVPFKVGS
jgi:membrane-associated protease RseP (regulator of RpoE activity)